MREDLYLLGHYGGPFFEKKDLGTWTIPKGEIDDNEDTRDAALRELKEETGYEIKEKENLLNLQYRSVFPKMFYFVLSEKF